LKSFIINNDASNDVSDYVGVRMMQVMMQAMGDGGVHDTLYNNKILNGVGFTMHIYVESKWL
jgi:Na+/H+ antiporter NhaA